MPTTCLPRIRVIAGTGQLSKLSAGFALQEPGLVLSGRQCSPGVAKDGSSRQHAGLRAVHIVPALHYKFKDILSYFMSLRTAWATWNCFVFGILWVFFFWQSPSLPPDLYHCVGLTVSMKQADVLASCRTPGTCLSTT